MTDLRRLQNISGRFVSFWIFLLSSSLFNLTVKIILVGSKVQPVKHRYVRLHSVSSKTACSLIVCLPLLSTRCSKYMTSLRVIFRHNYGKPSKPFKSPVKQPSDSLYHIYGAMALNRFGKPACSNCTRPGFVISCMRRPLTVLVEYTWTIFRLLSFTAGLSSPVAWENSSYSSMSELTCFYTVNKDHLSSFPKTTQCTFNSSQAI